MMTTGPTGEVRNPWAVIGPSIITLGTYSLYWQYVTFKELKEYAGKGIGGGLGLVFAFFIVIVNAFLMPSEVGDLYIVDGQQPPLSALTGLWILLPFVGAFVWVVKTQGRLNEFWESRAPSGAAPVADAVPGADSVD
jgi:hypothetical protein